MLQKMHLLQAINCHDGYLARALGSILDHAQCMQGMSTWYST
jgi:hypothetical protein